MKGDSDFESKSCKNVVGRANMRSTLTHVRPHNWNSSSLRPKHNPYFASCINISEFTGSRGMSYCSHTCSYYFIMFTENQINIWITFILLLCLSQGFSSRMQLLMFAHYKRKRNEQVSPIALHMVKLSTALRMNFNGCPNLVRVHYMAFSGKKPLSLIEFVLTSLLLKTKKDKFVDFKNVTKNQYAIGINRMLLYHFHDNRSNIDPYVWFPSILKVISYGKESRRCGLNQIIAFRNQYDSGSMWPCVWLLWNWFPMECMSWHDKHDMHVLSHKPSLVTLYTEKQDT